MPPFDPQNARPQTIAAQALRQNESAAERRFITPPIDISATYERDADNAYSTGYCYGRDDNATIRHCQEVLTRLENGASAAIFGSGMAAATTAFLALPRPAHIIVPQIMYWCLRDWLKHDALSHGLLVSFADMCDPGAVHAAIRPGVTKMIWAETPSNPLWGITDIKACAKLAHDAGAILVVDSTAATPVLTRPIELGADAVMHSATKYLNGHSDVIAGALVFAHDSDFAREVRRLRRSHGAILSPRDGALLLRGMRTVHLRVAQQCQSAMMIAAHFSSHHAVSTVLYPGLDTHPGHEIAKAQMNGGFGGMLSIRIKAGEVAAIAVAANVKLWRRATSLGSVESLIEHRASIEGPGTPCPPDLLRLSTGIEAPQDLIADLESALDAVPSG